MLEEFDGYVTDIDYVSLYYLRLSPTMLRLIACNQAIPFPSRRPLRYLELGYGNGGVSLNIHAAASPGEYWGIDVNPSHAAFADTLAKVSGSGLRALKGSFADLLSDRDLPDFDVIVAHGVWSWISDGNRRTIVEVLRRKLAEGGIFYLSYMAMPGSAAFVPLQQLLRLHVHKGGDGETIVERLRAGIGFADALRAAGGGFFSEYSFAADQIEAIKTENPAYLCHEYLNEHWHASSFAETAATLSQAGLCFVASTRLSGHFDDLNFHPEGLALLASIDDPVLRETARDFLLNRQFRTDVYVKRDGSASLPMRTEFDPDLEFVLGVPDLALPSTIKTRIGQIDLSETAFKDVLNSLRQEKYRTKTLHAILRDCAPEPVGNGAIVRALMILVDAGIVYPAQPRALVERAIGSCAGLNEEILRRSLAGQEIAALASPVTGGGIAVSRHQQLFLLALRQGAGSPDEWARFAWEATTKENADQAIAPSPGHSIAAAIMKEALTFDQFLPIFTALKVI